nr:hypothetical protein [Candidatus Aminicenantes bacterium]NIM83165.1 hypothetical protein [Candidatus Aminicenantes bacterium]NIN22541.1 hypothetical protein [Candidatus Aminicenantes bacterium]NIN46312.1 hypothetical protein [Candidatus Aminicenantes bacterium]NIN89151.1 hypothetical protein [Candidatus Aminicenantes bacterium]
MDEIKRTRYFQHEILDSDDFIDEQEYHRNMRYLHNSRFHTWGILEGLEVDYTEGQEPGNETIVTVNTGTAVDGKGREMVLPASKTIDFNDYQAGMAYYITIRWNQQEGLPRQEDEFKRWQEIPGIDISEEEPLDKDMNLVLAYVKLKSENNIIESIDNSMSKYATLEIGDKFVTSVKLADADGTTGQDTNVGSGVKTAHLQDGAVTEAKLDAATKGKLVTGGDNHTHGMSQLSDYSANDNKIINLQNPTDDHGAANKIYVDEKAGGSISSNGEMSNVVTTMFRQVNVSGGATVTGDWSQVNASRRSAANGTWSQVNASQDSAANGTWSQVNASTDSTTIGGQSQVNASNGGTASESMCQVNASEVATASGRMSQVNASRYSEATGESSQVNASEGLWGLGNSQASGRYSQVNASWCSLATGESSQVNASRDSTASATVSQVN